MPINARANGDVIRMYGANWCPDCRRSKQFLGEHQIPYNWVDIEQDKQAEQFVIKKNDGKRIIPTITFADGSFLVEPSNAELAAKLGYKEAAKAAGAVIMEPIMKLEVVTPEENMGDIVGDLNRRRGQVNSMDDRAGAKVVKANVPLSEMFGYVTTLRTLSSGRATSTMEFSHYAEVPGDVQKRLIDEYKNQQTADE